MTLKKKPVWILNVCDRGQNFAIIYKRVKVKRLFNLVALTSNNFRFEIDNESKVQFLAQTYLQLPWGACNVYQLVVFSWRVNIAVNPIVIMGL